MFRKPTSQHPDLGTGVFGHCNDFLDGEHHVVGSSNLVGTKQDMSKYFGSRLVAKPGCWQIGFRHIPSNIWILYHK